MVLAIKVRNSDSAPTDDAKTKIVVYCKPDRRPPGRLYPAPRSHTFDSLRASGASLIGAGGSETVTVGSVCQGVALSRGATSGDGDQFRFTAMLKVDNVTISPLHEVTFPYPEQAEWPFAVASTMWRPQTDIVGGLQLLPSGCTLSFPLRLKGLTSTAEHAAMSTTGHCTEPGQAWEQGSYPLSGRAGQRAAGHGAARPR